MTGSVIAAVLFAALMHAGWNTLVKAHAGTGVPTILVVAAPDPANRPFIAASALVQTSTTRS